MHLFLTLRNSRASFVGHKKFLSHGQTIVARQIYEVRTQEIEIIKINGAKVPQNHFYFQLQHSFTKCKYYNQPDRSLLLFYIPNPLHC